MSLQAPDDDRNEPESARMIDEAEQRRVDFIRDEFRYYKAYWKENREQSEIDMQYIAGDGWTAEDRAERKGRPMLWPDELSQYTKQAANNLRQNKREIEIQPKGSGATDQDAENREAYIRGIQHRCTAQAIYSTAFESNINSAFGYFRVTTEVTGPNGEQEPTLRRVPNQASVMPDPNAKWADFSDANGYFIFDVMRRSAFKKAYPNAKRTSFTADDVAQAPDWFDEDNVVVAEFWSRRTSDAKDPDNGQQKYKVMQEITNGIEILETNHWIGSRIPIIGEFGEELYVTSGGVSKRMFLSLIRRARVPQKMLAYLASQEAEEFQISPRVPYLIWEGQELADKEKWQVAHKVPFPYLRLRPTYDQAGQLLPPPMRQPFIPNAQAYETSREAWRRAIQAAMGITPLPTSAQRQNEKSGVALEKIQNQEAIGSFHFTDNHDRALHNAGWQINESITILGALNSLPKEVGALMKDGTHKLLKTASVQSLQQPPPPIADPNAPQGAPGQPPAQQPAQPQGDPTQQPPMQPQQAAKPDADLLVHDRGEFGLTIGVGPAKESQRDAESEFVDHLIANMKNLPIPPQIAQKILALAIKGKVLGPWGDAISELLDPPNAEQLPPEIQSQIAQGKQLIQELRAKVQQLMMEKQAKMVETQGRILMNNQTNETRVEVAEVMTKAQKANERISALEDLMQQFHAQAHEAASQGADHAHAQTMQGQQAAQQQAIAQQQQAAQQPSGQEEPAP